MEKLQAHTSVSHLKPKLQENNGGQTVPPVVRVKWRRPWNWLWRQGHERDSKQGQEWVPGLSLQDV